jgi:hypothetical protein
MLFGMIGLPERAPSANSMSACSPQKFMPV